MGYIRDIHYDDYNDFEVKFTFKDDTVKTIFIRRTPKGWEMFSTAVNQAISEGKDTEFVVICDMNGMVSIDTTQIKQTEAALYTRGLRSKMEQGLLG